MTRAVTLVGYGVLLAALLAWEAAGRWRRRSPTLGASLSWVARRRPGRWLLLAAWLWLGWHTFVRSGA